MLFASKLMVVALMMSFTGCNHSSFTDSTGTKRGATSPNKPVETPTTIDKPSIAPTSPNNHPQLPPPDRVPTDCGADGATQARLLTPLVDVAAADAHLEYEVYRTDCDGVAQTFLADKILFDLDAWDASHDMDATLTQDGTSVPTKLKLTIGSDLFGHTGSNWAHQETSEKVEIHGSSKSVRLRIELAGRKLAPRVRPTDNLAADGSVPIPTYLRFGNAAPIQVDVRFLHPGPQPSDRNPASENTL